VLCPTCRTENQSSSRTCSECGATLKATLPSIQRSIPWYWLAIFILFLCGVFLIYHFSISKHPTTEDLPKETTVISDPAEASEKNIGYSPIFGTVIILNILDEEVARIEAAVFNGSWIVLPTCFCYSGNKWIFRDQFGDEVGIKEGIWNHGDPVGLWQLDGGKEYNSPRLAPWEKNTALLWCQFGPESPVDSVPISSPQLQGLFAGFTLPGYIKESGVFFQDDTIVGWTFGKWLKRGFLWKGPETVQLKSKILVSDFYNSALSNYQEALFSKALGMNESTAAVDRLFALAEGFYYEPQFSMEDKHEDLLPKAIIRTMHSLVTELLQKRLAQDVVDILDDQLLQITSDPELFQDKTKAMISLYDYRRAMQYFERTKQDLFQSERLDPPVLEEFHAQLYKDWIVATINDAGTAEGWAAFNAAIDIFPDDLELHLLGVELAVSENDWNRAEELLLQQAYPQHLMDRARNLEILILEKKSEDGKVVIRFTPGAQQILVDAQLNGRKTQQFIVDTGASHVTIPSETAQKLSIKINEDTPVISVSTAAGVKLAYEVELDSIELKGLRVYNLKALIIDIPDMPQLGLLGNNFLENFQVEIDSTRGFLRLKRR